MLSLSRPSLGPLARPLRLLRRILPPLNFITIHYLYFILTSLLAALIFWGSSTPARSISFTNCLFLTVSAMTEAGLNTVNLSELNTFQQVILFVLIILGSAIWVSAFVVHVRWKAFTKRMVVVKEERERKRLERRQTGTGIGRVRRVVSWGGRSRGHDQETGDEAEKERESRKLDEEGATERTQTPPGRRGAPEMNGFSSTTGEKIMDDSEENEDHKPADEHEEAHSRAAGPGITFREDTRFGPSNSQALPISKAATRNSMASGTSHHSHTSTQSRHRPLFTLNGVGARPTTTLHSTLSLQRAETQLSHTPPKNPKGDISKYLDTLTGWVARNSQFHGLSSDERDLLGGLEYRAVSFLAWLVPLYFILFQLLGALGCGAWVAYNMPSTARENGLNPWWVGAFNAVSAFNNSGMSLLDANMVAFQKSYYMLLTMSLLILAGNTAYPIFLRLIVWTMWKMVSALADKNPTSAWTEREETLRFLLDHPRRCYTNLFPGQHTWWLAFSVFSLNVIDWAAFEILNINNHAITAGIPLRFRILDGLFQAFAVRSGGFYVVTISKLRISLLVLYVVMMYVSVYPVVITMRNSNVYEERSLGIYAEEDDDDEDSASNDSDTSAPDEEAARGRKSASGPAPGFLMRRAQTIRNVLADRRLSKESNSHFVRHQLRAQLAHDAWWIVLALFVICIIESSHFDKMPIDYSAFNIIFEIVSAYGCVGISVGVPWAAYSFSGAWNVLAKLVLCLVMLRGRHRGLPVAIDKAVLLPGDKKLGGSLDKTAVAEEEDGFIRLSRRRTRSLGALREGEE